MEQTIFQGSTPTNEFTMPFPAEAIEKVIISYEQNDTVVLEKHTEDITISDYLLAVKLTQEETLKFEEDKLVAIQIKVKTTDGEVIPSEKIYDHIADVINKELI